MRLKKFLYSSIALSLICAITAGFLIKKGIIWFTTPYELFYKVKGIDVSSYQGDIDWQVISDEGISFAFIKATEGSSHKDKFFQKNWEAAGNTDLRIGAYHFFSFDSTGDTQADNFIEAVSIKDNMLPPVVDIEFYSSKNKEVPSVEETHEILNALLKKLEDHYKMKPIIYATRSSYSRYIKGYYPEYDIWIRDLFFYPMLFDDQKWTFWQYNNQKKLKGYKGVEKNIDLNFYNGDLEKFKKYNK